MKNYISSLLADISYINFFYNNNIWSPRSPTESYLERNMKNSEIDFFNVNFKVIDQTSLGTGFSATTFQVTTNNVPGYSKGDIFVGYRGTEDSAVGLFTDGLYTDLGNVSLGTNVFY